MNVLLYSHSYSPNVGGVETFSARLMEALPAAAGSQALVVTLVTQTPGPTETSVAARLIRRPGLMRLWRLIGESDVVLLVGPALLPMLASLLRRRPFIVTHHGYQTICPNGLLFHLPSQTRCPGHFQAKRYQKCVSCCAKESQLASSLMRVLLTFARKAASRLAYRNISVSEHLANRLKLPASAVIRNGVPLSPAPRLRSSPDRTPRTFLFVGRMVAEKGIDTLIRAAAILKVREPSFQVLLVGDGPERPKFEELSHRLGLSGQVSFCGLKTGQQLADLVDEAFACVTPSSWEEAAGLSILEQMMAGKAVVASQIGGLTEEVTGAGLIFPPGDALALADCMQELLSSPALVQSLGRAARQRAVSRYSAEEMVARYTELLHSLQLTDAERRI